MIIAIGIDPGINTGCAVWSVQHHKFTSIETLNAVEAMDGVRVLKEHGYTITLFVEDCRDMQVSKDQYDPARLKGVGSVQRDVKLWIEFAEHHKITIHLPKPGKYRKVLAQPFATLTGWKGRTSEHARAAGMMVFGLRANDHAFRQMRT